MLDWRGSIPLPASMTEPFIKKGSIVVVSASPNEILYVTVEHVIGPIKGKGWLAFMKEGNFCLISGETMITALGMPFPGYRKILFLTDKDTLRQLADEAGFHIKIEEDWNGLQQKPGDP